MLRSHRLGALFAAIISLWFPFGTADAALITAKFNSTIAGGSIERIIDDSTTGSQAWTSLTAGQFSMTRTGGDYTYDLLPTGADFLAFCAEPQQGVTQGQTYTWSVGALSQGTSNIGGMGTSRASSIAELLGGVYPLFGATTLTNSQALAIQIAIWEIVRETTPGAYVLASGHTRFRNPGSGVSDAMTLGQSWLDQYVNDGSLGPTAPNLLALIHASNQDLVVQRVPLPGSFSLLLTGLLILGNRRTSWRWMSILRRARAGASSPVQG